MDEAIADLRDYQVQRIPFIYFADAKPARLVLAVLFIMNDDTLLIKECILRVFKCNAVKHLIADVFVVVPFEGVHGCIVPKSHTFHH